MKYSKWIITGLLFAAVGCESPTLIPNPDPELRKTSAQLAADSAKRFPYKSDTPRAEGLTSRAEVNYDLKKLSVVNLSKQEWHNVELWVNQQYCIFIPDWKDRELKRLDFKMIFDDGGNYFPLDNSSIRVLKVEALMDGKVYNIPVRLSE
jgi:hypothetical protein